MGRVYGYLPLAAYLPKHRGLKSQPYDSPQEEIDQMPLICCHNFQAHRTDDLERRLGIVLKRNLKDPQYVIEQRFELISGFLPYPPADLEIYFPEHILLNGLKPFYFQDLEPNQHADLAGLGEFFLLFVDLFGQMEIELDDIVEIGHAGQHFDSSAMVRLWHNLGLEDLEPFAEKLVTEGLAFFEPARLRIVFLSLLIQPRTGVLPAQPESVCQILSSLAAMRFGG
jgi:hypothetical protein